MKNNLPTISVVIVTWNSKNYILGLLKSIAEQSYAPSQVIVVDNSSDDETVKIIREFFSGTTIIENRRNLGFSKSYNQGFKMNKSEYVLACNHDIILDKDYLLHLANTVSQDHNIGSIQGKLMKFKLDDEQDDGIKYLDIIDTAGIAATRSREFYDRGQDQTDKGDYDEKEEIFGVTGALGLFKKSALEKVKINEEYFDEDFFAYKEDVDMAWRIRLAGYKSIYQPKAKAWHARGLTKNKQTNRIFSFKKISEQLKRDKFLNYLSYRNQLLLIAKCDTAKNIFKDFPFMGFVYIRNIIYYLIFQPSIYFKSWSGYFKLKKSIKEKAKIIQKNTKISAKEIRKWLKSGA